MWSLYYFYYLRTLACFIIYLRWFYSVFILAFINCDLDVEQVWKQLLVQQDDKQGYVFDYTNIN